MRLITFFVLLTLTFTSSIYAQGEKKDMGSVLGINFHYGYHIPGGDLADRFGSNFNVGASVDYITPRKYLIFGVEGGFLFGNQVKENVASNISSDGNIIGNNRSLADYQLRERGLYLGIVAGKIFPIAKKHKRSGIRATIGLGLLQHKIRLQQDRESAVLQFEGAYSKGYDRLTNGLTLTQFIGYQHLSNNRYANFLFGFEFTQGFTKNRRSYNFNEMRVDTDSRTDLLFGFKVAWTLPFYFGEEMEEIFY